MDRTVPGEGMPNEIASKVFPWTVPQHMGFSFWYNLVGRGRGDTHFLGSIYWRRIIDLEWGGDTMILPEPLPFLCKEQSELNCKRYILFNQ